VLQDFPAADVSEYCGPEPLHNGHSSAGVASGQLEYDLDGAEIVARALIRRDDGQRWCNDSQGGQTRRHALARRRILEAPKCIALVAGLPLQSV